MPLNLPPLPKISEVQRINPIGLIPVLVAPLDIYLQYYRYIQDNFVTHSRNFELAYRRFYMKSAARSWAESDFRTYFDLMYAANENSTVESFNDSLIEQLSLGISNLSFASKAIHTINPTTPIYDRLIRNYLSTYERVRYLSNPVGRDNQLRAYSQITNWFDNFMNNDPRYNSWIEWFDKTFSNYQTISNIKKIDFIILSCR